MDNNTLTQFYDQLKSNLDQDNQVASPVMHKMHHMHGHEGHSPEAMIWRNKAAHNAECLKDDCRKHILVDIYCKIIPLDDDYVCGHHGQMKADVDQMLQNKDMTASQYLTSCYEATKAPMLEFILRSTDTIGKEYMKEADETLKDAEDNEVSIPDPKAPSTEDEEVVDQLVDVKNDTEYETFIDKLKQKTINKIVNDVSKIISDKKEEKNMTFSTPATESADESFVSAGVDYLQKHLYTENGSFTPEQTEEMIGMAIREATLNQFDVVFNQPGNTFKEYASRIRYGKGVIINESAVQYFKEETTTPRYEPLYKEVDGVKYDVSNFEKIGKDDSKTRMTDAEAKSVLDSDGYKRYQSQK